jgi:hypothetical protein
MVTFFNLSSYPGNGWKDGLMGLGFGEQSPTGRSQGLIFKEACEECKSFHWLVLWHSVA